MNSIVARKLGASNLGFSIDAVEIALKTKNILVVGGVHGDETEGIQVAEEMIKHFLISKDTFSLGLAVIPCLNPDGKFLNTRSNFLNVDLNRNLETSNWNPVATDSRYQPGEAAGSEPETKAFQSYLDLLKPDLIVSIHSFSKSLILYHDYSKIYTERINQLAQSLSIPVVSKMEYTVFGSLNSLGIEKGFDVVTIECPKGKMWEDVREDYTFKISRFLRDIVL